METAVMEPPGPISSPGKTASYLKIVPPKGWAALNIGEVWQFRDLLMALAGRDVKLRYKQTALGIIWVVLQPLLGAAIFSFVFNLVAQLPTDGIPSLLFTYVGLMGWNLFSTTLSKSSACLVGNSQLISKIYFPRLVLPFSVVPSVLIDFGVAAGMMVVLMMLFRWPPSVFVIFAPLCLLMLLAMSVGLGLITAALTVSYRDVQYILPVVVQILTYATPIAYSAKSALKHIPAKFQFLYFLNPLVGPIEAFRIFTLGGIWPPHILLMLCFSTLVSVGLMVIGGYSFKKMERKFADVI